MFTQGHRARRAALVIVAALLAGASLPGCEMISNVRGVMTAMGEVDEHLQSDLKAPLTDEKITLLLIVTPELIEFSKTAEHKWEPDPSASDMKSLSKALGGLSDYIEFFDNHGTRLTEYYVLMLKVHDARHQVMWKRAHATAVTKLVSEAAGISGRLKAATNDAERRALEREQERNKLALERMENAKLEHQATIEERRQSTGKNEYKLSDQEVSLVAGRIDEINAVFEAAGYTKNDPVYPGHVAGAD